MTRIPYRDSEDGLSEEQLVVFRHIKESRGSVIGVFAALMGSSKVAELVADFGKYMRFDSILSDHVRELTIATALAEYSAQFEWGYHEEFADKAGISPEAIDAVKFKKNLAGVAEIERELIEFGRELIRNKRISPPTYSAVKQRYSEQELTEITALFGYYACVSSILNAFEIPAAPGKATLPEPA
jgi:4-carboxymuconolactone decarboxylase